MISIIKKLFKKEDEHKGLIDNLIEDHKNLLGIYTEMVTEIKNDNFAEVQSLLNKFMQEYRKHILIEDTKLYIALEEKYKDKKQVLSTIQDISKDMDKITKSLNFFKRKYSVINEANRNEFIKELEEIGAVLVERIELEEERLYTLL